MLALNLKSNKGEPIDCISIIKPIIVDPKTGGIAILVNRKGISDEVLWLKYSHATQNLRIIGRRIWDHSKGERLCGKLQFGVCCSTPCIWIIEKKWKYVSEDISNNTSSKYVKLLVHRLRALTPSSHYRLGFSCPNSDLDLEEEMEIIGTKDNFVFLIDRNNTAIVKCG